MPKKQTMRPTQLPLTVFRSTGIKSGEEQKDILKLLPGKPHKLPRISPRNLPPKGYEHVRTILEITDSKGNKRKEEGGFTRRKVQVFGS